MLRSFLATVMSAAFLLSPLPAFAETPTFSNGFYFYSGNPQAYALKSYVDYYWIAPCYSCGYQRAGYWAPYTAYYYAPVKLNLAAPDIESQMLALAGARDKAVLRMAEQSRKSAAALALADKLGLTGNFAVPGYGMGLFPTTNYAGYSSSYSQVGSIGATVFAAPFTFNQTRDVYQSRDPNVADQQSVMLVQGAQRLAGDGFQQRMALLDADGARAAALANAALQAQGRVGTHLAAGAAAAAALNAAAPKGSSTSTTITGTTPVVPAPPAPPVVGPPSPPVLPPVPQAQPRAAGGGLTCASCHNAQAQPGKFNFETWDAYTASPAEFARVRNYISPDAPDGKRCPPKSAPLSDELRVRALSHRGAMPAAK